MAYTVYMHTTPSGKRYVGITQREADARWRNGYGYVRQPHFYSAIQAYGWDNIRHEILATGLTKEEAEKMECHFIQLFNTMDRRFGYNHESGGNARKQSSTETRRKISEANSGERHWNYGKRASDKTRAKLRVAVLEGRTGTLGKHLSEETRRKIREANLGKTASEETRQKMSESHRGEKNAMYGRQREADVELIARLAAINRKPVINLDTGEVYCSVKEAGNAIGRDPSQLAKCCKGLRRSCGGYHWAYYTPE